MGIFSAKCTSSARLDGKTVLVTGSNTGIGKSAAKEFYKRGARVLMACRNLHKAEQAADEIKVKCGVGTNYGEILLIELNLANLQSVRNCANYILKTEERLNVLVNNAGVMMCPKLKTEDGFEMQFGTNYLGHFLLTLLLLPKICQSTPARIVNVSSMLHSVLKEPLDLYDLNWENKIYDPLKAYQQSKLANILFTKELARKLEESGIEGIGVYSLHPGVVQTELGRHFSSTISVGVTWLWNNIIGWFLKTPEQGAQTVIYCAIDEKCANETGLYYAECTEREPFLGSNSLEVAEKLWEISLKFTQLKENYNPFR